MLQVKVIKDKLILNGFKVQDLVDLSEFDTNSYFEPIVATKTLWRALLWAYPGSQKSDHLDPSRLVYDLTDQLLGRSCKDPIIFSYRPEKRPAWLPPDFSIGVYYAPSERVLLYLEKDFDSLTGKPLPTSMVVKLVCLLDRLRLIAWPCDQLAVQELCSRAQTLSEFHPIKQQIKMGLWNNRVCRLMTTDFTREEYRALLLVELGQLLELMAACGLPFIKVAAFAKPYETLSSPLNELLHITRTFLILSSAMPDSCKHLSPFDDLIYIYATLKNQLDDPESAIPQRLLIRLRTHAFVFSKLLPVSYREELVHCEQKLTALENFSRTFPAGTAYPPKYHIYH